MLLTKAARGAHRLSTKAGSSREAFLERLPNEQGIAVLNLNRPEKKNALGHALLSQISREIKQLRNDSTMRVLIVRSLVENCFCAGADLKERAAMRVEEVAGFVDALRNTMTAVSELPMPTIAAIDGAALGGGLELALACDLRIAGTAAKMGLPECALAILPAAGGSQRLPRLIGVSKAKHLIFTGRIIGSEEALALGVVNESLSGSAYARALEIARKIASNGPIAVRMAKRAVDAGLATSLQSGQAIEQACYAELLGTEDRLEGLTAFKERRTPNYKGK